MGDNLLGTDLYRLDDLLTDEQKLMRRAVARLVDEEFLPNVQQHFRDGTFPTELAPRLGEMGLLGMNLHGYGCPGTDNVSYGLAMQELERGDSGPGGAGGVGHAPTFVLLASSADFFSTVADSRAGAGRRCPSPRSRRRGVRRRSEQGSRSAPR